MASLLDPPAALGSPTPAAGLLGIPAADGQAQRDALAQLYLSLQQQQGGAGAAMPGMGAAGAMQSRFGGAMPGGMQSGIDPEEEERRRLAALAAASFQENVVGRSPEVSGGDGHEGGNEGGSR